MTVTNDELANYRIEIEIKDSAKKYTIDMDKKGRILVLEGARASLLGWVKNPDELEKNKDNLGAVVVNRKKKEPVEYPDFENFYKTIKK